MRNAKTNRRLKFSIHASLSVMMLLSMVFSMYSPPEKVSAQTTVIPAQMNKSFLPLSIEPGGISVMEIEIFNPNPYALTNMGFTDDMTARRDGQTYRIGLEIADDPGIVNTCGGTVTADPGATTLTLSGGSIAAAPSVTDFGVCSIQVNVTSIVQGNLYNFIPVGALTADGDAGVVSNTSYVEESLNILAVDPPSVTKSFAENTVWTGETSRLTLNIRNNEEVGTTDNPGVTLTEVSLADTLPINVVLADPVNASLSNCGPGTVTAVAGSDTVTLNNGSIAPQTTCQIQVDVVSTIQGEYTNTIPVGDPDTGVGVQTRQGVTNGSPASADLHVQAVDIDKAFSPTTIDAGETSTLTITIENPTGEDYTGVQLSDTLPGSVLAFVDGTAATTCTADGTSSTDGSLISLNAGLDTITLTGGTVQAGDVVTPGTCTITVDVTAPSDASDGSHNNVIPADALITDQGITNDTQASASLTVNALSIDVSKSFTPDSIYAGNTTTLRVNISNNTNSDFTGISLTDDLEYVEAGLTVTDPVVTTTTCSDNNDVLVSVNATAGGTTAGVSGVALDADESCYFEVDVISDSSDAGSTITNRIPANSVGVVGTGITNTQSASDNLDLYLQGEGLTGNKSFSPNVITAGENTRLQIRIYAPDDQTIENFSIVDDLPPGFYITNSTSPNLSGCGAGAMLSAPDNGTTISLTGGEIAAGGNCRIRVWVTSDTPASEYTNIIEPGDISNTQGETIPNDITTTIRVTDMEIEKAFYPDIIAPGGSSTLTITLRNTNYSPLVDVSLTDFLSSMGGSNVVVADEPNISTTCGGSVVADAGTQEIQLNGGTIPAEVSGVAGICTINVDVTATGANTTRTNTLYLTNVHGTILAMGTVISPVANATAQLRIEDLTIEVIKGFKPSAVFGGAASEMSIVLINPNSVPLLDVSLVDNMPAGMYLAYPANLDVGICGGELVGASGDSSFTFSGGYLPAGGRCTLHVDASMNINGNLTNTIQIGEVTTFNGASNDEQTGTTLTNLPGVSVIKYFDPAVILGEPGTYSTLTIELENRTNIPLTNLGVIDNLPGTLPEGLYIDDTVAPTTDCGGTLSAVAGTQLIELDGGGIAGYETCTIEVPVTSTVSGEYVNTIPAGTVTTDENATNKEEAEDTLTVNATYAMQISKDVSNPGGGTGPNGSFQENDTIQYEITVTNTGDVTLTNVTVTDDAATLGTCTPVNGSSLAAGASMVCAASHLVTADEVAAGEFTNTATADSDQTDPVNDDETVPLVDGAALSVNKVTTSSAPYDLGDVITYEITVRNIGTEILNNVQVTDPGTNVTLGSCVPVNGSALAVGASMLCTATHEVTQDDVNAGEFSNTAFGDSDETDPESDEVTVPITENPKLKVYKEVITEGPFEVGDEVEYEIIVQNSGNQTLHNVTVSDAGDGVTLGACDPVIPVATLLIDEYITCSATYTVTQEAFNAGRFTNVATADSDETEETEGDATIYFEREPEITLTKTGTLDNTVVAPDGKVQVDAGDTIAYEFTVENTGDIELTNVEITDPDLDLSGISCTYDSDNSSVNNGEATLDVGESMTCTVDPGYTLEQEDINAGSFTNTATVTGEYPPEFAGDPNEEVTDTDDDEQTWTEAALIGVAKQVVDDPVKVSAGTWDVTFEIYVENYSNVDLVDLQVTDDLSAVFADPTVLVEIRSLTSDDFSVNWPGYDGIGTTGDTDLLDGTDTLDVGESGTITVVARVIPANSGPFLNTAVATAETPDEEIVTDDSQSGVDPDPEPSDGDPTNNNEPTPVDFGPNLFDPPSGVKELNASGLPLLEWTMIWINDTNIVAIAAEASDEIPFGTTFEDSGVDYGNAMPATVPADSSVTGVFCDEGGSTSTTTTYCYYEGPTTEYPRGRIVWVGSLGPDLGAETPDEAVNDIAISFFVRIDNGVTSVENRATIDADLNGDGDVDDPGESIVADASEDWRAAEELPDTGFAPGKLTVLPAQPIEKAYGENEYLELEIPMLNMRTPIVTVPLLEGDWDVTWLGENAGYLIGSAYPTWNGNTVITAHNWSSFNQPGPFADLSDLHYGDQIKIHAFGLTYVYEVRDVRLVTARNLKKAFVHEELDWVTLMTCEGYDSFHDTYVFRRLVRAVLVDVK